MKKTFSVRHVNFVYHTMRGETPALSEINFDVNETEFLAIVGPSGCGKTTLLNLLCGLLVPASGSILLNGRPLDAKSRLRIGYMLQQDYLLEWRSILKNVLLGPEIRGELSPETKAYAGQLLKQYGLEKFADAKPGQLSGGMRQRAALVRTLVLSPELLLLDEPFSALDYQTRLTVGNDIGSIIREQKKTAVLVTHDLAEAVSLADRILILSNRPGSIRRIIAIELPPGLSPLERRNHPAFKDYFQQIWEELHEKTQTEAPV
ncbi:MAG: ATP-binding cassette domain-containing protein [Lachnospiraceae bacterium]|nr:ATP-binding cassette domain-containing protein [Lachnospiraceae bacterium]